MNTLALKVSTPSDLEIVMTRSFNARRKLVWDAMTRPDLLQRWMFAPPGWSWTTCEMDVRVGGAYRWEWNGPDGRHGMSIRGIHREVDAPRKIVHTERMEMGPGAPADCGGGGDPWELIATIELTERDGQTHLTMTLLFPTKQARDVALASRMEHGVSAGYDRLDELLPTLAS
jgi:uncharacterized protein YndB with AHSA1/START domain